jgi:hypothetical protein
VNNHEIRTAHKLTAKVTNNQEEVNQAVMEAMVVEMEEVVNNHLEIKHHH